MTMAPSYALYLPYIFPIYLPHVSPYLHHISLDDEGTFVRPLLES